MDNNNVTYDKAYKFAIRIINAYKYSLEEKKEFVLSKQLMKKENVMRLETGENECQKY